VAIALFALYRIGVTPQFFWLGTNDYLKAPTYSLGFGDVLKYTSEWMRAVRYDPKTGTRSLD
jgi:hypothetical protein